MRSREGCAAEVNACTACLLSGHEVRALHDRGAKGSGAWPAANEDRHPALQLALAH